jgi:hypothetical protein
MTEALHRSRFLLWAAAATAVCVVGAGTWTDWRYYNEGGHVLLSRHALGLYSAHPAVQIGPLSLLAGRAIAAVGGAHAVLVAQILLMVLLFGVLHLIERLGPSVPSARLVAGGLALCFVWPQVALHVELADGLALALLAAAALAVYRDRSLAAGLCLGLAVAAKPWALPAVPLLLGLRTGRVGAIITAAATTAVAYTPFVIAHPHTLHAGVAALAPQHDTLIHLLGYSSAPWWVRPTQAALGIALGLVAVHRGRWEAAVLAAVAVRIALDPGAMPYYDAGLVAGALVVDRRNGGRPVTTVLASVFVLLFGSDATVVEGARLALLCLIAAWIVCAPRAAATARTPAAAERPTVSV